MALCVRDKNNLVRITTNVAQILIFNGNLFVMDIKYLMAYAIHFQDVADHMAAKCYVACDGHCAVTVLC